MLVTFFVSLIVFPGGKAYTQSCISDLKLNEENTFRAPFINSTHSLLNSKNVIQNSEQDIIFIENIGQIRDLKGKKKTDVLFFTRSQGVDMYITKTGITYVFRKVEGDAKDKNKKSRCYRLDMEFAGMNKIFNIKKELAIEQQFNYYTPEYPNGISPKAYKKITIENIYNGTDLVYYEKEGNMKYDLIIRAGAYVSKIKMIYKGAGSVYLEKDGSMIVTTPMGEIREEKPYTYSRNTGKKIECSYKVIDNSVCFNIPKYDDSEDIIIDPVRIWATYYGGSLGDGGTGISTDNSGNLYISGTTQSNNLPTQTLSGAYNQTIHGGGLNDIFILKFNSAGARIWATYYGGSIDDYGSSNCTDNSGNLYVLGITKSTNFPTQTLTGAYNQSTIGGSIDAVILKFDSNGARTWATYYGGNNHDYSNSICTDNSNNQYITGNTKSNNFPTQILSGAYNQAYSSGEDIFILKFNNSNARIWATYYGGSNIESGNKIYTDNSDNIYVAGNTNSTNFPTDTLTGAYNQTSLGGSADAVILKFNGSCARTWATYYGGSSDDFAGGIFTDYTGNLYVSGNTGGSNFPIQSLSGAYNQPTFGGGSSDIFLLKFNNSYVRTWATYYGGSNNEYLYGFSTDDSSNLYVTGFTQSTNFPIQTLAGAYNQATLGGSMDAYILNFDNSCARTWATYYGGSADDGGSRVSTDIPGTIYFLGWTNGINFPLKFLPGAYNQSVHGGGVDTYILRFGDLPSAIKNISTEKPSKYYLHQNYPNPFNPITNIRFDIPRSALVKIVIYNVLGKELKTLINNNLHAGRYEVNWPAPSGEGSNYPSGVYFYKIITDGFVDVRKMLLIK